MAQLDRQTGQVPGVTLHTRGRVVSSGLDVEPLARQEGTAGPFDVTTPVNSPTTAPVHTGRIATREELRRHGKG